MSRKRKNIHILYVLTKLELGGAQKICLTLLKDTPNKNVSTSLISGTEGVLVPAAQKHNSLFLLKSLRREVGIKIFFLEFAAFFKMISIMRKLKKKHPHIIVHTHSTKAGLIGRWAAFFARIKNKVHTVHGFGFHEHQSKLGYYINFILEYITSLITTHYICVSNADRKIGKKLLPRFNQKSSIIRAAVDWNSFTPATLDQPLLITPSNKTIFNETEPSEESTPFIFGTISCLKPQKNLIDLLKAFKHMYNQLEEKDQQRVKLEIIGDGIERSKLEQWIATNNLSNKIFLLGWQSNVSKYLQSWHVFTMSSLWEGLPCAIVEARLSKLPVVSYKIAGIPEVIKNNLNGFLIHPGKWSLLGKRMKELIKNKALYTRLSLFNDNLIDFKNEVMVKKHLKLYKKLR